MAEKKKQNTGQMRLDKFLTEMGKGSRSQVKEFARKGRIQVNGQTVKAADTKVNPEKDEIFLDGVPVSYARMEYFMLNKPQGTVSATEDVRYPVAMKIKETFESIPGNPYDYEYHEGPGVHEWVFWDEWIHHFLDTVVQKGGR